MKYNLERANNLMEEFKIDALLTTSPYSIKYLGYNSFESFLEEWCFKPGGAICSGLPNWCLIPYNREPVYIIYSQQISFLDHSIINNNDVVPYGIYNDNMDTNIEMQNKMNKIDSMINKVHGKGVFPMVKTVHAQGAFDDALEALTDTLKRYNLENSTIGIEEIGISKESIDIIKRRFKRCEFKDSTEIFRLMRMIKTPNEIETLKESANLNEETLRESIKLIQAKEKYGNARKKFQELINNARATMRYYVMSSNGLGFTENENYIIDDESSIYIDSGILHNNYFADTGITLFIGKVSQNYHDIYKKIFDILNTGFDNIKPGKKCSEVSNAMKKMKTRYNLENCLAEGHGIGVNHREYPIISDNLNYSYNDGFGNRSADFTIEENMVINLEVPFLSYNQGSLQIEKTVYVTENSCKDITYQDRKSPFAR